MTKLVSTANGGGNDVDSGALEAIGSATVTSHTATKIVIDAGGGQSLILTGTGFGSFNANGFPTTGTVTGLIPPSSGNWSGFSISASTLLSLFQNGDVTAFENAFFSGNDVFISHDTSTDEHNDDVMSGFGGNDSFNMTVAAHGAFATLNGGDGNDVFNYAGNFDAATDQIDGGGGADTLKLAGDYSEGLTLSSASIANVERLSLTAGNSYNITSEDGAVASGKVLTVNGLALGASDVLTFDGSAETNGRFIIEGGAGKDTLTGGKGSDKIEGGAGADQINAGSGHNIFVYTAVNDSLGSPNEGPTGSGFDTITGMNMTVDKFDLWFTVTGVDAEVTSGQLRQVFFDDDMSAAINGAHLAVHHAVLFTPTTGDYVGKTFLVVEANGVAGYQSAGDLVIELNSAVHLSSLATGNFI